MVYFCVSSETEDPEILQYDVGLKMDVINIKFSFKPIIAT